jgi:hypothetical protein
MSRVFVLLLTAALVACSDGQQSGAPESDETGVSPQTAEAPNVAAAPTPAGTSGNKLTEPIVPGLELDFEYNVSGGVGDYRVPANGDIPAQRIITLEISGYKITDALAQTVAALKQLGFTEPEPKNPAFNEKLQELSKDGIRVNLQVSETRGNPKEGALTVTVFGG